MKTKKLSILISEQDMKDTEALELTLNISVTTNILYSRTVYILPYPKALEKTTL